jgi:hypothetical protein
VKIRSKDIPGNVAKAMKANLELHSKNVTLLIVCSWHQRKFGKEMK